MSGVAPALFQESRLGCKAEGSLAYTVLAVMGGVGATEWNHLEVRGWSSTHSALQTSAMSTRWHMQYLAEKVMAFSIVSFSYESDLLEKSLSPLPSDSVTWFAALNQILQLRLGLPHGCPVWGPILVDALRMQMMHKLLHSPLGKNQQETFQKGIKAAQWTDMYYSVHLFDKNIYIVLYPEARVLIVLQ